MTTSAVAFLSGNVSNQFRELSLGTRSDGVIGTAADTVDRYQGVVINQTTINQQALTLPNPTDTTPGCTFRVRNSGNESFGIAFSQVFPGHTLEFIWTGSVWKQIGPRIGWASNSNNNFQQRTVLCGGMEFRLNQATWGASCTLHGRIVDTSVHGTSFSASSIFRKSNSSTLTTSTGSNPAMSTSYAECGAGAILDNNYQQISVRLEKRSAVTNVANTVGNGVWMIDVSDNGSIDMHMSATYFGGH